MTSGLPPGERPADMEFFQLNDELEEFVTKWMESEYLTKEDIAESLEHWVNWLRK